MRTWTIAYESRSIANESIGTVLVKPACLHIAAYVQVPFLTQTLHLFGTNVYGTDMLLQILVFGLVFADFYVEQVEEFFIGGEETISMTFDASVGVLVLERMRYQSFVHLGTFGFATEVDALGYVLYILVLCYLVGKVGYTMVNRCHACHKCLAVWRLVLRMASVFLFGNYVKGIEGTQYSKSEYHAYGKLSAQHHALSLGARMSATAYSHANGTVQLAVQGNESHH